MRKILALSAILVSSLLLAQCDSSTTTPTANPQDQNSTGWDTTYAFPYTANAASGSGTIFYSSAQYIYRYCSMNFDSGTVKPILRTDTSKARLDTITFRVNAGTLMISAQFSFTTGMGEYKRWGIYRLVTGSGNELAGTWDPTFLDSLEPIGTVLGVDTTVQRVRRENAARAAGLQQAGRRQRLTFSSSTIQIQETNGNPAILDTVNWNSDGYYRQYAVDVKIASTNSTTYTGRKTHEVVTKLFLGTDAVEYRSTDTAHKTYREYDQPTNVSQCPENSWFGEFLSANGTTSTTNAGRQTTSIAPRKSPLPFGR